MRRFGRLLPVLVLLLSGCLSARADEGDAKALATLRSVDQGRIESVYRRIAAFGSRLTGSRGERGTFDFVERQLRSLGATSVKRSPFPVTVPDPESTGKLTCGNAPVTVWPLWPNLVRTSTCNVRGRLVYGGKGTLAELDGKPIKGSIVLLEVDSGANWRNPAKLGAAAVVFLQPDAMNRSEAEAKFSQVPLGIPRFYLPLGRAEPILTAAFQSRTALLRCRQDWVSRTSWNLTAEFAGTDPALGSQPIELVASADSISVVPGLAPGAEAIGSMAGLLECARYASLRPHARTLRVVLSGAHSLALRGARELALSEFSDSAVPLFTLTLDLSSGSSSIAGFGRGWFYEFRDEQEWVDQQISGAFEGHAEKLASLEGIAPSRLVMVDAVNNGDNRNWRSNIPGRFALDCEPLVLAGLNAMTFRTIDDDRDRIDTPFDTLDQVRFSNVVRQIQTTAVMLDHLLSDPVSKSIDTDDRLPLDPVEPARMRLIGGFATLAGQVDSYDPNRSFIPDTPQPGCLACVMGRQKTFMGVRGDMIQFTEGAGAHYRFDGVETVNSGPITGGYYDTVLQAFHVDPATGGIDLAPTWTLPGFNAYDLDFDLKTAYRESPIVVFPAVGIDLYDLSDPQTFQPLMRTTVLDADTGASLHNYGLVQEFSDGAKGSDVEDAQELFLPPGQRFQLVAGTTQGGQQLILTNSTPGDEKGTGYVAPGGTASIRRSGAALGGVFDQIPLQAALDLDAINSTRIDRFRSYRILGPDAQELEQKARTEIRAAQSAVSATRWEDAEQHGRAAWGFALRAHPIVMGTANDVVEGIVFYLFLLIPFSYFLERLIVGSPLISRQAAWTVGIFVGSFVLLRLIHPAFQIVGNPAMIFVAFAMGALSLLVGVFIVGKFEGSMRDIRAAELGLRDVDIKRGSVAMAAFNLGIGNMRRRKARTVLTTLTLAVMTFIVLSFTSIVSRLSLNAVPTANLASYAGLLIRQPGLDPLPVSAFESMENEFGGGADVVRRAYSYGNDPSYAGTVSLQRGDKVADLRAMLGLDPSEALVTRPQAVLLAGRWFQPGERYAMILPDVVAQQLKVDPSEVSKAQVTFAGTEYTVVGIASTSGLRGLVDLDGDGLMAPDFSLTKEFQTEKATANQALRSFIRLDPSQVFLVPAARALELGADLRSIAVRFKEPSQVPAALDSLMPRLRLNLYASVPSAGGGLEVEQFSFQQGQDASGLWLIAVQLLIAGVFVLNTMVASVYERTREIGIFSSIGLAPNHIATLFFAESLVYCVLGTVIGYFTAQAVASVIVSTGSLPGLTLNFSSLSAVFAAIVVMAVVLGSTIYPARLAARIAAPAIREEAFESEPDGDLWNLPLPFSLGAAEAGPVARFLAEWLRAYEGYTIGEFVTADVLIEEGEVYRISATAWLAPFDLGVSQRLELVVAPTALPEIYALDLRLTRLAGDAENWVVVNRRFLAALRRQFLGWRALSSEERERFLAGAPATPG